MLVYIFFEIPLTSLTTRSMLVKNKEFIKDVVFIVKALAVLSRNQTNQ